MELNNIETPKYKLQQYLIKIAEIPERLNNIDIVLKKELLIYIDNEVMNFSKEIFNLINNNPNYNYDEKYLPDKLFEYWEEKIRSVYYIPQLKNLKILIEKSIENEISINNTKIKNYKNEFWFIVGVWIATGELETLLIKYKNPTQIGKNLYPNNWSTVKTYIGDSKRMDKIIKRDTNIFNYPDKIKNIYNHCTENDLTITNEFIEFYNKIEPK